MEPPTKKMFDPIKKKYIPSLRFLLFMAMVILSALVERFSVSRPHDFFHTNLRNLNNCSDCQNNEVCLPADWLYPPVGWLYPSADWLYQPEDLLYSLWVSLFYNGLALTVSELASSASVPA